MNKKLNNCFIFEFFFMFFNIYLDSILNNFYDKNYIILKKKILFEMC